jgi:very-short-patch-repair endonuclease
VVPHHWKVQQRGPWPVPPLETTVRQIAAVVSRSSLRDLVQQLLLDRRTTIDRLRAVLGRGLDGSAALRELLVEIDPACHEYWERLIRRRLARAGVATEPQILLVGSRGRRAYLDLGIRAIRFGVEIDGFASHMRRFAADRRRARMVCLELGWELAPVAVAEIAVDEDAVIRELLGYLRARLGRVA